MSPSLTASKNAPVISGSLLVAFEAGIASRRQAIASWLPVCAASSRGVRFCWSTMLGCAPASSSIRHTIASSRLAAKCKAVRPSRSFWLSRLPLWSSIRHISRRDRRAASIRAVQAVSWSCSFVSAPCSSNDLTRSSSFVRTACISAGQAEDSTSLMAATASLESSSSALIGIGACSGALESPLSDSVSWLIVGERYGGGLLDLVSTVYNSFSETSKESARLVPSSPAEFAGLVLCHSMPAVP